MNKLALAACVVTLLLSHPRSRKTLPPAIPPTPVLWVNSPAIG